jgi:hypothetical protein
LAAAELAVRGFDGVLTGSAGCDAGVLLVRADSLTPRESPRAITGDAVSSLLVLSAVTGDAGNGDTPAPAALRASAGFDAARASGGDGAALLLLLLLPVLFLLLSARRAASAPGVLTTGDACARGDRSRLPSGGGVPAASCDASAAASALGSESRADPRAPAIEPMSALSALWLSAMLGALLTVVRAGVLGVAGSLLPPLLLLLLLLLLLAVVALLGADVR